MAGGNSLDGKKLGIFMIVGLMVTLVMFILGGMVWGVAIMALMGVMFVFFFKVAGAFYLWDTYVTLIKIRHGTETTTIDKGRMGITPEGYTYFELKNSKQTTKPIEYPHISRSERGIKHVILVSTGRDDFHPAKLNRKFLKKKIKDKHGKLIHNPYYIEPVDTGEMNWRIWRGKQARMRWEVQSKWTVYLPVMIFIVALIGTAIYFAILGQSLEGTVEKFNSGLSTFSNMVATPPPPPAAPSPAPY